MTQTFRAGVLALLVALPAASIAAQPPQGVRPAPGAAGLALQPASREVITVSDEDAERTRERLRAILRQYPPSLADVLRLDPTLLTNDAYLAPYPELAAFLKAHPNIAHNPGFFVGAYRSEWTPQPPRSEGARVVENTFLELFVLTGVVTFMGLVGWSIKKLIDHRRWLRMSKLQADAHAKIFDRLSGNEELLAYIQSPAGQKFLESAPIITEGARSLDAPVGRILFTAQIGTVVTFVGVALSFASSRLSSTVADYNQAAPFVFTASVLMVALGLGFIASAGVAYLLSRRLGLVEAPGSSHA